MHLLLANISESVAVYFPNNIDHPFLFTMGVPARAFVRKGVPRRYRLDQRSPLLVSVAAAAPDRSSSSSGGNDRAGMMREWVIPPLIHQYDIDKQYAKTVRQRYLAAHECYDRTATKHGILSFLTRALRTPRRTADSVVVIP